MNKTVKLTRLEKHWILYDIGNSAFILLVATLLPIYFEYLTSKAGLSDSAYLAYWGYAGSLATILVAVIAPICGTLADQKGFKRPLFLTCMILGTVGCAFMGAAGHWLAFLGIYVIAKVGYSASLVFYDSMLPEITTADRMDNVSSGGYAYGYIGSVIPFLICLGVVLGYEALGISQITALILAFVITAVWWLLCSVPLAGSYRQKAFVQAQGNPVAETFRQLGRSLRDIRKEKHIFVYLLSFFFFIDGVYTIIEMATAYGKALGLETNGLLLALLLTQIVAFPCCVIFGRLSAKVNTAVLIKICILCYTGITLFAVFLQSQWQFWVLAVLVGMFQGGIQALSRSYLGKIIPPERSGEYYGIMDICGKGASFVGMTLVGLVSQFSEGMSFELFGLKISNLGLAVGTLVVQLVIGYFLFCRADRLARAALEAKQV